MTDDPRDDEFLQQMSGALPGLPTEPRDLVRIRAGIRRRRNIRWAGVAALATAGIVSFAVIATAGSSDRQTIVPPIALTNVPSSSIASAPATTTTPPASPLATQTNEEVLAPATVPSKVGICRQALTYAQDGRGDPILCTNGFINALAWSYYASVYPTILGLGPQVSEAFVLHTMCATKSTTPTMQDAAQLAAAYYGWAFASDAGFSSWPFLRNADGSLGDSCPSAGAVPTGNLATELSKVFGTYHGDAVVSEVTHDQGGPLAFIAHNEIDSAVIDVLRWGGNTWSQVAQLDTGMDPLIPAAQGGFIQLVKVTGSPESDAVVLVRSGTALGGFAGVVVSDVGGTWHLVLFQNGRLDGNDTDAIGSPAVSGSTITSRVYDSCGQGCATPFVQTRWTYSVAVGKFVASPS